MHTNMSLEATVEGHTDVYHYISKCILADFQALFLQSHVDSSRGNVAQIYSFPCSHNRLRETRLLKPYLNS